MKNTLVLTLLAGAFLVPAGPLHADTVLAPGSYLAQVEADNPEIRSTNNAMEALGLKTDEMFMAYSPYLSVGGSYGYDASEGGLSGIGSPYKLKENHTVALNAALTKKYPFGSTVTLGYSNVSNAITANTEDPGDVSFTAFSVQPYLKVEQSLIKDFKGGQTATGIRRARTSARSGQYQLVYKKQQQLLGAQTVYWRLSMAREVLAFRKASLERAEKLLDWTKNRRKLDLVEDTDLLQAQASCQLRRLSYQQAVEDELNACRAFNEFRGTSSTAVPEQLMRLPDIEKDLAGIKALTFAGERADVRAARETLESAQLAHKETALRTGPDVTVTGQLALNGLNAEGRYFDAWKEVTSIDKPVFSAGIQLVMPFDDHIISRARSGYDRDTQAAREALTGAELSEKNDRAQLQRTWDNVKNRLALAEQIKTIQSVRVEDQQSRIKRGRTSTFLLLNAEGDLDDATLSYYGLILEEVTTWLQASLYAPVTIH